MAKIAVFEGRVEQFDEEKRVRSMVPLMSSEGVGVTVTAIEELSKRAQPPTTSGT